MSKLLEYKPLQLGFSLRECHLQMNEDAMCHRALSTISLGLPNYSANSPSVASLGTLRQSSIAQPVWCDCRAYLRSWWRIDSNITLQLFVTFTFTVYFRCFPVLTASVHALDANNNCPKALATCIQLFLLQRSSNGIYQTQSSKNIDAWSSAALWTAQFATLRDTSQTNYLLTALTSYGQSSLRPRIQ